MFIKFITGLTWSASIVVVLFCIVIFFATGSVPAGLLVFGVVAAAILGLLGSRTWRRRSEVRKQSHRPPSAALSETSQALLRK